MGRKNYEKLSEELLSELHPTKNRGLNFRELAAKSAKRLWWVCGDCAYEWQAPVYHRSNGTGCPKCRPKLSWIKRLDSMIKNRGSLAEKHPLVAAEWHPERNGSITPEQITASSGKKFWWKCSNGDDHEWEASVSNRTKGRGCPVCSGRKAVHSNSLVTTHPNVAKEWHQSKNGALLPSEVTYASHKRVWWLCQKGHEWQVSVANRTSNRISECPLCLKAEIGQRRINALIKRDGSFAEVSPEIAKQWHPSKNGDDRPSDFTAGSRYRAWWKCDKGHEWCAPISARKHYGCPKCTNQTSQLEIRIYCELKEIFPEVLWREQVADMECDIFLPNHMVALEIDGFPWHEDREIQDKSKREKLVNHGVNLFRIRDDRLLRISKSDVFYNNKESHLEIVIKTLNVLKNEISLSDSESEKLIDYLRLNKLVNEEAFKKMYNDACAVSEEKSIAHLHPIVVENWDYEKNTHLDPKNFSPGSNILVYWNCKKNSEHKWKRQIQAEVKSTGCPFCIGKRACSENSLATLYPHLAAQWDQDKNDDLTPQQVTAGSSKKVHWKCACGVSWKASIWSRVHSGKLGCLDCYNKKSRGSSHIKKVVLKKGAFSEKFPELAKEWHPEKNGARLPSMLSCGSSLKVWWKCTKGEGHEWQNSIVSRIQYPTCPFCCGKKVSSENSFKERFPKLAAEWHSAKNALSASEVTKCSGKKVWWQCEKGHEWEATVNSRAVGRGCPFCAGKRASVTDNFSTLYPKVAAEWNESKNLALRPSDFRPQSNVKVWWRCSMNPEHEWTATITSRANGAGCPFCAGKKASAAYSLAVVNPGLAREWHPEKNFALSSKDVTPNSGRKVWWQCARGHSWKASVNNRAKGRGCPFCRKRT